MEPTAYPEMSVPAYFALNGTPAIIGPGSLLPQVLNNGRWEFHYDPPKFRTDAVPITKEEFDKLVSDALREAKEEPLT
jgi:hypothetical protein